MVEPQQPKKAGMILFSASTCIEGHACRIVLHEKEVECDVEYVNMSKAPNPILESNPYGESPTLIDRELKLYGSHIIAEYLDDRLPHPPLMPPDPINRSRVRMMIYHCQRDWLDQLKSLDHKKQKPNKQLRNEICRTLSALTTTFQRQQYWLGDEFSMVDCYLAPLIFRLPFYGIELPPQMKPILAYGKRVFKRSSFLKSLSPDERDMSEQY